MKLISARAAANLLPDTPGKKIRGFGRLPRPDREATA